MKARHVEFLIQGLPQEGQVAHVSPHFSSGSLGRSVAAAAFPGVEELEPHWDGAACPQSRTEHILTLTISSAYKKPKV